MFAGKTAQVIIVHTKETRLYAELLRDLFALRNDREGETFGVPDGSVKATVMQDKEFLKLSKNNTSDQKVIYIGKCEGAESTSKFAKWKQDRYGMRYGWFGNKAVILVAETLKKKSDYEEFLLYAQGVAEAFEGEFSDAMKDSSGKKVGNVLSVVGLAASIWIPVVGIAGGANLIRNYTSKCKEIREQQYEAAVRDFYMRQSAAFLFGE